MADLLNVGIGTLSNIYGISHEMAIQIKKNADGYLQDVEDSVKVKLSVDDKSEETATLVLSLYQYNAFLDLANEATNLLSDYKETIQKALADIKPAK